jgi:hypothetical protein
MMGFDVQGDGEATRFFITQEGARLSTTYGNEHIAPEHRTNRYLDDAIRPDQYARVVDCYRACVEHKRPTYTITTIKDPGGKEVSYERLLLPLAARSSTSSAPTRRSASTAASRSATSWERARRQRRCGSSMP